MRSPIGMLVGFPYSLGIVVIAAVGFYLRDWRSLYIAISFPGVLLLPVALLLSESPRWLLQVGKLEEAKFIIRKAMEANRVEYNDKEVESTLLEVMQKATKRTEKEEHISLSERFKQLKSSASSAVNARAMRKILILCPTIWCLSEMIYYGVIFNANSFSGTNPFLYVGLTGIADGIAILLGTPGATHLGRRTIVAGSQFLSGALLLLVLAVPELKWLQWTFIMTGFLMCACGSQALFVYTPELYPTTIRARGFAFCNLTGYVGTFLAPFIPEVLASYAWWITGATLGSMGFIASSFSASLPETNGVPLCETIKDVEDREAKAKARCKRVEGVDIPSTNSGQNDTSAFDVIDGSSVDDGIGNPALVQD